MNQVAVAPSGAAEVPEERRQQEDEPRSRPDVADDAIVVAGGGDGTITTVASELLNTNIPLGILPLGTLNHFAKDLRIPLDLEAAARSIATGRVSRIDVGEVNGRIFLNNSALGVHAALLSERQHRGRRHWGKLLASAEAAVSVLRRDPFLTVRMRADGEELTRTTPLVLISNNRYSMQGFRLGTRAALTRGELCLYVARRANRADLLGLGMRTLLGMNTPDELDLLPAREIDIETRRKRVRVALDGEVMWIESPLHYRSRPGALRVIVPASAAKVA